MYRLAAPLILLAVMAQQVSATIADGANGAQFESICKLLRWQQTGMSGSELTAEENTVYNDLQKPNLSLAPESWRKQFKKSEAPLQWQTDIPASKKRDLAYKYFWADWVKAAQKLPTQAEADNTLTSFGLKDAAAEDKRRAAEGLHNLLRRAKSLDRRLMELNLKDKLMTTAKIQERLNQAVYGKPTVTASDPANADGLGSRTSVGDTNRQATCSPAASSGKAATAAAVAICLCGKNSVTQTPTPNACWTETGKSVNYPETGANTVKAAFEGIRKYCTTTPKTKLTAAATRDLHTKILSQIAISSTGAFFGNFLATGCNGKNDGGGCVGYTGVTQDDSQALHKIKWLQELEQLASDLEISETAENQAAPLVKELQDLLEDAKNLLALSPHHDLQRPASELEKAAPKSNGGELSTCDKQNKTVCESTGKCKWDSATEAAENHCKPKEGEGQKTQGTEGAAGTNAEGKKCSEKTTEAECKDRCKWEGKQCKDSSILVDKKFVLSMAAAFVGLLF